MITLEDLIPQEQWKVVTEFPGYEISSLGRVRDKYNQKQHSVKGGSVILQKGKMRISRSVALLMSKEFGG